MGEISIPSEINNKKVNIFLKIIREKEKEIPILGKDTYCENQLVVWKKLQTNEIRQMTMTEYSVV